MAHSSGKSNTWDYDRCDTRKPWRKEAYWAQAKPISRDMSISTQRAK